MRAQQGSWRLLALVLVLLLVLAACERPLQTTGGEDATATQMPADTEEEALEEEEAPPAGADETPVPPADEGEAETEAEEEAEVPADEATPEAAGESPRPEDEAAADGDEEMAEAEDETEAETTDEDSAARDDDAEDAAAEEEGAAEDAAAEDAAAEDAEEAMAEEEAAAEDETAAEEEAAVEETAVEETAATGERTHVVQAGENLYRIGLQYGLSWVVLAEYNNISSPNTVYAGQTLKIPPAEGQPGTPTPTPTPPQAETTYVVQPGDYLRRIAEAYGTTWQAIAEANGIVNPNRIYPGQVLTIPVEGTDPEPDVTHTVQRGETLYLISVQYGVSWPSIAEANNLSSPYVIYPGQTLVIPGG